MAMSETHYMWVCDISVLVNFHRVVCRNTALCREWELCNNVCDFSCWKRSWRISLVALFPLPIDRSGIGLFSFFTVLAIYSLNFSDFIARFLDWLEQRCHISWGSAFHQLRLGLRFSLSPLDSLTLSFNFSFWLWLLLIDLGKGPLTLNGLGPGDRHRLVHLLQLAQSYLPLRLQINHWICLLHYVVVIWPNKGRLDDVRLVDFWLQDVFGLGNLQLVFGQSIWLELALRWRFLCLAG